MQQLHLVGFTTDHKGLILGTRRGTDEGSYVVTLDQALIEQIEVLLRLQAGETAGGDGTPGAAANGTTILLRRPKAESKLTPREVQSLLRTGRSVSEVAEAAGMSEDWIGRFAPPILAEQARVIERALGLTYTKAKLGPSIQPLGESVIWNLAERKIILSGSAVEDAWTAFQQPDGCWVVRVSYLEERRRQHADWTVDMAKGGLKAVNRLANELAYLEPGRRRPAALPPASPVSASAQRAAAAAPPKPSAPPPLPPRPSGRLSLLGTGAGGVRRQNPPAPMLPRDRVTETRPAVTPPREAPRRLASPPEARPFTAPLPPPPVTEPEAKTPLSESKRVTETNRVTETKRGSDVPPAPEPERPGGARRAVDARRGLDTPPASEPERPGGARRAVDARRGVDAPQERRARPLRPLSATRTEPPEAPPSTSDAAPDAAADAAAPPAAPPAGGDAPRPRRERPLRAPSRVRLDELSDPSVPAAPARPAASKRLPRDAPSARAEPSPELTSKRFGPAASSLDRRSSTAERFGMGRAGGGGSGEVETSPAPRRSRVAVDDRLDAEESAEPEAANGGGVRPSPLSGGRPRRARPLRAQGRDKEPEAGPDSESSGEGLHPAADEVYRAFASLTVDDPVTAPVPAVDFLEGDDYDLGDAAPQGRDQVLIRAGQAGTAEPEAGRAPSKRGGGEDRQPRPGRLKLRRRPQAST